MFRLTLLSLCILLLTGCASAFKLQLDAIVIPSYQPTEHPYQLLSGDPDINSNDLYYQEFSRFAKHALTQAGLQAAADEQAASQHIYFSYGVVDGGSQRYSYSTPVYDFVGGDTYTISERTVTGSTVESKTTDVYVPFSRRIVGRDTHTRTINHYRSFVRLEGRDNSEAATQRWMITIELLDENNDLRTLLPIMLSRAAPLIGKNSGQLLQIKARANDDQTQRFIQEVNGGQ